MQSLREGWPICDPCRGWPGPGGRCSHSCRCNETRIIADCRRSVKAGFSALARLRCRRPPALRSARCCACPGSLKRASASPSQLPGPDQRRCAAVALLQLQAQPSTVPQVGRAHRRLRQSCRPRALEQRGQLRIVAVLGAAARAGRHGQRARARHVSARASANKLPCGAGSACQQLVVFGRQGAPTSRCVAAAAARRGRAAGGAAGARHAARGGAGCAGAGSGARGAGAAARPHSDCQLGARAVPPRRASSPSSWRCSAPSGSASTAAGPAPASARGPPACQVAAVRAACEHLARQRHRLRRPAARRPRRRARARTSRGRARAAGTGSARCAGRWRAAAPPRARAPAARRPAASPSKLKTTAVGEAKQLVHVLGGAGGAQRGHGVGRSPICASATTSM